MVLLKHPRLYNRTWLLLSLFIVTTCGPVWTCVSRWEPFLLWMLNRLLLVLFLSCFVCCYVRRLEGVVHRRSRRLVLWSFAVITTTDHRFFR